MNRESGSFALQNSRFYRAKPTLLERKTIGFKRIGNKIVTQEIHLWKIFTVILMKFSYVSYATKAKLGINKKEDFVTEILLVIRMGSVVTQYGIRMVALSGSVICL